MAFTSWAELRTALKDAYADHIASGVWIGSYTVMGRRVEYKTEEQFYKALAMTYKLEALESPGGPTTRITYGRHRRFR